MIALAVKCLLAYLLGSLPSAYLVGKCVKRIDIREHGSGNVGASNVFRVVGKKWGLLVLFLDIFKGYLAVRVLSDSSGTGVLSLPAMVYGLVVGIAVVAGHNWTIFLGFRGGKGVATSLGVALALMPKAAMAAFLLWVVVLCLTGYISLASILAALSFPIWVLFFYRGVPGLAIVWVVCLALAVLVVLTHRSNIQRLYDGTEHRILNFKFHR